MGLFRLFFISLFIVWTNVAFAGYECNSGADCARKGDIEPDQKIRFRYHQKACNVYNEPRACYSVSEYFINNDKQPEQVWLINLVCPKIYIKFNLICLNINFDLISFVRV